ncbi:MAG: S41 family peptidase [Phycisphaerales bacterium]|nr:MAG: S41 family peptidase [Phycisphaerales bacterium]
MFDHTRKRRHQILLVTVVFSFGVLALGARLVAPDVKQGESGVGESLLVKPSAVEVAGELIANGEFEAADRLIQQSAGQPEAQLGELAKIIQEYEQIDQHRRVAQETAYAEQLAELKKFQVRPTPADANDAADVNDVADLTDMNDVNNVTAALSVIAGATEFADAAGRSELLSSPFVTQVFQRAAEEAAEFELKGEWVDAYAHCYYWLQMIDPNNKAYSDYSDELLDKASIVASFQDSPCETREERYKGVKKRMFTRAVEALNWHYVSEMDYAQMAIKALRRCQLLAEVMDVSFSEIAEGSDASFRPPEKDELSAWLASLAGLMDEVEQSRAGFDKDDFMRLFQKILVLNGTTVELPEQVLIAQFAEAAFSALDPYTVMVWPRQVQDFEKMMTNEFTGIGVEISKPKGLLTIRSLLPDTPAYEAGLDAGDVIEAVDGLETKDMTLMCAVHKITGPKGTKVTLTIRRTGEEKTREITITRARIIVPTIRGWQRTEAGSWLYMLDAQYGIGYIRITSFSADTASDFESALNRLESEGLKGLILDLRFNTGGFFDSAVGVADKFIKRGLIVRRQPGFGRVPSYEGAHEKGTHPDYPLVVLVNSASASASEIVAGALGDEKYNRAVLVGERTHGKGLVQGITHYPGGGAQLKYTMAHYHLPSGQRVKSREAAEKQGKKDWGVGPDIEIKLRSDEVRKMIEVQRRNDVLVQADRHEGDETLKKHTIEETLAADPQLAVAVLVVRSRLIQADVLAQAKLN